MPLYEYKCNSCDKTFEVLQKMNEEPLKTCLYCNGHVSKLVSSSSFQFKGNGWYVTDYKNRTVKDTSSKEVSNISDTNNATIK